MLASDYHLQVKNSFLFHPRTRASKCSPAGTTEPGRCADTEAGFVALPLGWMLNMVPLYSSALNTRPPACFCNFPAVLKRNNGRAFFCVKAIRGR